MTEPRAGCGAAIVVDGRILLMRRLKAPEADHWGLPGGKIDLFEPASDACEREIAEELGLVILADDLLCLVDLIDRAEGTHWIAPVYLVTSYLGEPRNMEPAKCGAIGWFDLEAPPHPLTRAAVAALAALKTRKHLP
jgi:ADP-ribose pyrophosphatase YjhB (NUDIX family)